MERALSDPAWESFSTKAKMYVWIEKLLVYRVVTVSRSVSRSSLLLVGKLIERDDCTVSSALRMWIRLSDEAPRPLCMVLMDRLMPTLSPVHLLVALLSPRVNWS